MKLIRFFRTINLAHLLLQAWQKSWKVSELLILAIPLIQSLRNKSLFNNWSS